MVYAFSKGRLIVVGAARCKLALQQQVRQGGIKARLSTTVLLIPTLYLVKVRKNSPHNRSNERFGALSQRRSIPKRTGRREREILQLVKERRLLRKAWKKAEDKEKEGLKNLWNQIQARLADLRCAERIRKHRNRKEKARLSFLRDPFKFARGLLEEKKSGKLHTTQQELEVFIKSQISDSQKESPLRSPGYIPQLPEPTSQFDTSPPKWSEVKKIVEQTRAASAPGPNGVTYRVYKNCPLLLKHLWKLMGMAWKVQSIPVDWSKAVTTFIPKEKDSSSINQFRGIALLNVEGKILFSVLAKRLTSYLLANNHIDTSCQKAGVPGFPGCVEHSAMIWDQIQTAKRNRSDLHVVWLDLENAYGSVPHQLISFALNFLYVPLPIQTIVTKYFNTFQVCYTTQEISTGWYPLERGIAMGCSISPILFTAAFEIILIGGRQMV
ncbi:uncharacterized protein LOC107739136 [Sinocyclocheilus rhinocerous]|uniref:uncharacterized protein LOC107739136 n=1 Tax=Sinocyclocheilus rhinocerous TaxID=307959 RepID=UPI0007B7F208|nr:PREDICTED: uncharacterized protein LOC107739136 [Sinocyclocheilus rhinocerous]